MIYNLLSFFGFGWSKWEFENYITYSNDSGETGKSIIFKKTNKYTNLHKYKEVKIYHV